MSPRSLSVDLVLVPVNQSEEATRAAEYVAAVAAEYDIAVHAVHALDEDVIRAVEQGVVNEGAVTEDSKAVTDAVSTLAKAVDVLVITSVACGFSRTSKLRHLGSVVLDAAEELDVDSIVVPREPTSGNPGEMSARAIEYVLLYASQSVFSVRILFES